MRDAPGRRQKEKVGGREDSLTWSGLYAAALTAGAPETPVGA